MRGPVTPLRGAEWVLFLNNDVRPEPGLADRLAGAAHDRGFDIIGPIVLDTDGSEVLNRGTMFEPSGRPRVFREIDPGEPGTVAEVDIVNGCCLMISRAVFLDVGLLDERLFLVHEESDLCLARRSGYRCGVLQLPLARHVRSATLIAKPPAWRYYPTSVTPSPRPRRIGEGSSAAETAAGDPLPAVRVGGSTSSSADDPAQRAIDRGGRIDALADRAGPAPARPGPFADMLDRVSDAPRVLARGVEQVRTSARTRAERAVTRGERRR